MEKAALWRIAEAYSHVQRPDRQILFHPVTDRPTHNAAAMQIKNNAMLAPSVCLGELEEAKARATNHSCDSLTQCHAAGKLLALLGADREKCMVRGSELVPAQLTPLYVDNLITNLFDEIVNFHCLVPELF
jgi:hypothetical protein